ncbi:hypothetical protein SO802_020151 [Lithocarpus litseifolius]|uniref:Uncharacterized protein n=1 Tax=Lithocarpus litseifolius TaxID=425828 RepID=A0AAW2CB01_9ROSI
MLALKTLHCKIALRFEFLEDFRAFHALRCAAPIRKLGNRLARRMWIEGLSIALHLRLEKNVWGHRANVMHRKYIKPNKQAMHPFFDDTCISDAEFRSIMRKLHNKSQGQPKMRANRSNRDVIAYLIPECMCKHKTGIF